MKLSELRLLIDELDSIFSKADWYDRERERSGIQSVPVGFPIGTILFACNADDGFEEYTVVGETTLRRGSAHCIRFVECRKEDLAFLRTTKQDAVKAAFDEWRSNGDFDESIDIKKWQRELDCWLECVEWAEMCLAEAKLSE